MQGRVLLAVGLTIFSKWAAADSHIGTGNIIGQSSGTTSTTLAVPAGPGRFNPTFVPNPSLVHTPRPRVHLSGNDDLFEPDPVEDDKVTKTVELQVVERPAPPVLVSKKGVEDASPAFTKLDFYRGPFRLFNNSCGGALIASNMVLTANHCFLTWHNTPGNVLGDFTYGQGFAKHIGPYQGGLNSAYIEFSDVDLGLVRLAQNVDTSGGDVKLAALPAQCSKGSALSIGTAAPVYLYRRMDEQDGQLPPDQYGKDQVNFIGIGKVPHTNGLYYRITTLLRVGDSGGPWLTNGFKLIGINNATNSYNIAFGTAICNYSQEIVEAAKKLDPNVRIKVQE